MGVSDIDQFIKEHIKELFLRKGPFSMEEIVQYLKDKEVNQLFTVKLLMEVFRISLGKAQKYVYTSKAWGGKGIDREDAF